MWRHTRRGDKYVTVIIDLTPIRDGTGPSRLLDMVEGRSKQVFKQWLAERHQSWRDAVEVVAMDGFTGFKTTTTEELPDPDDILAHLNAPNEQHSHRSCQRTPEHLHGSVLGFRNLTNYITRSRSRDRRDLCARPLGYLISAPAKAASSWQNDRGSPVRRRAAVSPAPTLTDRSVAASSANAYSSVVSSPA